MFIFVHTHLMLDICKDTKFCSLEFTQRILMMLLFDISLIAGASICVDWVSPIAGYFSWLWEFGLLTVGAAVSLDFVSYWLLVMIFQLTLGHCLLVLLFQLTLNHGLLVLLFQLTLAWVRSSTRLSAVATHSSAHPTGKKNTTRLTEQQNVVSN